MDDKRFRFTEKEKTVLFGLFKQYQDIIDIRHRKYSQSQHKQFALRKCWDTILDEFNAHPDTGSRSMKQIQKFWLNSKLRKRLPSTSSASNEPQTKTARMETILMVKKDRKSSSDAAYRELAKHCKDEITLEDPLEDTDEPHDIEVTNVSESYDEQYENLNEAYYPSGNETIALKVIDNQLNYNIPTPSAANLVAIPQSSHILSSESPKRTHLTAVSSGGSGSATSQGTTYIAYTPTQQRHTNGSGVQLIQKNGGSFVITSATPAMLTATHQSSPSQNSVPAEAHDGSIDSATLAELQRQEMELKVREAKLRVEVQEIEKEKTREELIQMREMHRLKIKEMEQRLRNMERTSC